MFQHILVPLDGSSCAEQALPVAARIAHASGGSLLLMLVVSPPLDYGGGLGQGPLISEQLIESEMSVATEYLKSIGASPLLAGIDTGTEVSFGQPAQQILAAAEANESDLIVLCSHGRTGFARWALGSVAHKLVHQCRTPVLVLRQSETPASLMNPDVAHPLCTLVPLDGSLLAEDALVPAASLTAALAAPAQGALHLVQVVKSVSSSAEEGFVSEFNEEARRLASTYLAKVAESLQAVTGHRLAVSTSVETGTDVTSSLLEMIEHGSTHRCDLIAISTHGRGDLDRWIMGSVTERLLNTTKLPMLIVHPPKKA